MTGGYWDLMAHVRGALSEALVAEAVYQRHSDAVLYAPRHPGYDVSSAEGELRVDAKAASLLDVDLTGTGEVAAVEWDAGSRDAVLHESATHLGLAVLDDSLTTLKLYAGEDVVLRGEVAAQGRVFLVPGPVVRAEACPIWSTRHGRPSRGRFRYIRLETLEPYEVKWRYSETGCES
ncbi:hypothetical protein [Nocardiopsis alba]|uniref:hypothetical protein n=1 Tax=Nocardiopsis alba TaxID=53437 RepID=UPI0035E187FE